MEFLRENSKNFLRLAMVILCMVLVFRPNFAKKQYEKPEVQYGGVGGSGLPQKIISGAEAVEISESLEAVAIIDEPEIFSKPRLLLYDAYVVQKGENISTLALTFGLNDDTIISINKIRNSRLLQIGQVLKIPNQDGIFYAVKDGDTLNSIAETHKTNTEAIQVVNELFTENIKPGTDLFIPGARLDWAYKQEINGDLFLWPVSGYMTSPYGYRRNPFDDGVRQFHTGMDISAEMGAPVRAAMSGRVSTIGYDDVLGNYVVISHYSGYRTLYGHMSVVRVKMGAYVSTGERIGDVGSTGLSTGPHVHFTVYKNGVTVNPRALIK
ncbi:MAG: M23 family metallopeptidase [Treponema sp.]|jgi:murein DD-endopeptidase MepM/ murein hydrolase activator NlpD|nr:M23 family metallopeptidase [Treponema sp.]